MSKALIIVDIQNDFVEGGSLAVTGGKAVASKVSSFLNEHHGDYTTVVTTQDWHIDPKGHWSETPDFVESWPVHCEAYTEGAAFVDELNETLTALRALGKTEFAEVVKGEYGDDYSGFEGHLRGSQETLESYLNNLGVTEVEVVGIATDYCVKATAEQAVDAGFKTTVLMDMCAGIAVSSDDQHFKATLASKNINVK